MLAEDLLLLLTDDTTGRPLVDTTRLDLALAGAVLVELTERGHVGLSEPGGEVKPGRVVVTNAGLTLDSLLDDAMQRISARKPVKPESVLPRLTKGLRPALLERLTNRGILRAEEGTILGVFPRRSWPAANSTYEDEVRRGLRTVLVDEAPPGPHETALVSLLYAVDAIPKVVNDSALPKRELKQRAKRIAKGEFAGAAVQSVIASMTAAVAAAVATTAAASD